MGEGTTTTGASGTTKRFGVLPYRLVKTTTPAATGYLPYLLPKSTTPQATGYLPYLLSKSTTPMMGTTKATLSGTTGPVSGTAGAFTTSVMMGSVPHKLTKTTVMPGATTPKASVPQTPEPLPSTMFTTPKPSGIFTTIKQSTTVPHLITKPSTTPSQCGRCICGKPPTTLPGPVPSDTIPPIFVTSDPEQTSPAPMQTTPGMVETPVSMGSTPGPKPSTGGPMQTTPGMVETPVSMQTTVSVQSTPPSKGLTGFTPYVSTKKPTTGSPGFMPYLLTPTTPNSGKRHVNRGLFKSLRKAFL